MSASSSTLWATASKEWVIQPKPKPGRKPKKEPLAPVKDDQEVDAKGRRFQNRAAQRAFRERKQSQLSELQARIQSYEQGEIERNVALQSIAKRLKEENEQLRQENTALQSRIAQLVGEAETRAMESSQATDKKRLRDQSPQSATSAQDSATSRKKAKKAADPEERTAQSLQASRLPSPTSMVSTPESTSPNCTPYTSSHHHHPYATPPDDYTNFDTLSSGTKPPNDILSSFAPFGCGFCDGGNICVCQEIAVHEGDRPLDFKNDFGTSDLMEIDTVDIHDKPKGSSQLSILDNLPAYQPALPLRRRTTGTTQVNSIFPVTPLAQRPVEATCSGDPSNCLACGDDAFGKAFCDAMGNASATKARCDGCPGGAECEEIHSRRNNRPPPPPAPTASTDIMPTNDAWRQLKAHPNVHFADLSLLAEVVASRSKCLGPTISVSPPTTRDDASSSVHGFKPPQGNHDRNQSPPRLVPQEVLLECGRRSLRHVHADGVREALRLLDAKFS